MINLLLFHPFLQVSLEKPLQIWHAHLGHPNYRILEHLKHNNVLSFTSHKKINGSNLYVGCRLGKSHQLPFSNNNEHSNFLLDGIHCDLWGPSPITFSSGF